MHLYQCFDKADKKLDVQGHLNKTRNEWANLIESVRKERPVMIGEWSLGLDGHVENEDIKAYAKAQLDVFNKADGWFFWTYKTEEQGGWNFRHCVETGLIPSFINY